MPASLKANKSVAQLRAAMHAETVSAVEDMQKFVQAQAAKYPQQRPTSTYTRTGTMGRSVTTGPVIHSGGAYRGAIGTNKKYAPAVERGTGVYGPSGQPIKPKNGKLLAWVATRGRLQQAGQRGHKLVASGLRKSKGRMRASPKHDTMMIFARSVRGFPGWFFMRNAMTGPQTKAYIGARLTQLVKRVNAQL